MNTKKYIEITLMSLLEKKPIDKIKVNEIIRKVETCKGTFYKYYRDKYELLYSCFQNNIYAKVLSNVDDWEGFMLCCLAEFEKNPAVILNAFRSEDVNSIRYFHEKLIMEILERELGNSAGAGNSAARFAVRMCAAGYTDVTLSWLASGMKQSKEDLILCMKAAMPQSIYSKACLGA